MGTIKIATRASNLAVKQAELVINALNKADPNLECILCLIETTGDKLLNLNLSTVGGKGLFLKEIENSLLNGDCDIAVHSMKDVPVDLPEGLIIPAMLERGDARDTLISKKGYSIYDLPQNSIVGTCASRRSKIINSIRPDLTISPIRGNIQSRIRKMEEGQYDAIVLALCGIERSHINELNHSPFSIDEMVPAIGQGAIGIECRKDDIKMLEILQKINHDITHSNVSVEREFMKRMDADCTTPIGGYAIKDESAIQLKTYYYDADLKTLSFSGNQEAVVEMSVKAYTKTHI